MSEAQPMVSSAVSAASEKTDPLTPRQRFVVLGMALAFAALPFFFIGELEMRGFRLNDLQASAFFFSLGVLPGAIGICFHVVMRVQLTKWRDEVARYYAFRDGRPQARKQEKVAPKIDDASSDPLAAIAGSLFLTGIFLLIAVFAGFEATEQRGAAYNGVQGMMYAGLGAYVAVLYYMVPRLYANALSSRFLLTSALRTASAVALGWVFGIVGVTAFVGLPAAGAEATGGEALASNALLFLAGLFHNSAIDALRTRAMRIFGRPEEERDEVPLTTIEGIHDTTADLLTEYGVGTVQHLATAEPGELCERTLLPCDRVLDWIDQAMLVRYLRRNISVSRALGIRGAINLALVHRRADGKPDGDDAKLLASLAEKVGMPFAAIDNIAREMRNEYMVGLIYELQQGRPFPGGESASAPATAATTAAPTIPITQPVDAATPAVSPT